MGKNTHKQKKKKGQEKRENSYVYTVPKKKKKAAAQKSMTGKKKKNRQSVSEIRKEKTLRELRNSNSLFLDSPLLLTVTFSFPAFSAVFLLSFFFFSLLSLSFLHYL